MSQLPERTADLVAGMDRMVELLDQDGHTYWNSHVREAANLLRAGSRQGYRHFLSGFGTSGSLNECVVGKGSWIDGKFVWEAGQQAVHEEFERLQSSTYTLARQLQRESEPPVLESLASAYTASTSRTRALLISLAVSFFALVLYGLNR